ncbi:MAG: hypothetical protein HeimC3_12480 [Candidatus Heimdallarchaeota archaeon LC_3]|nr:MAG: hypothetical protein HeimC3_12480 [Candidatus Heimdallarchaeota archaeon LC_3]
MVFEEKEIKIEIPALKKTITISVNASTTVNDVIIFIVDYYNQEETEELKKQIKDKLVLSRNQKRKMR